MHYMGFLCMHMYIRGGESACNLQKQHTSTLVARSRQSQHLATIFVDHPIQSESEHGLIRLIRLIHHGDTHRQPMFDFAKIMHNLMINSLRIVSPKVPRNLDPA